MKKDIDGIELQKEKHPDVPELLADPGMIRACTCKSDTKRHPCLKYG